MSPSSVSTSHRCEFPLGQRLSGALLDETLHLAAGRVPLGVDDFTGFEDLLEVAQVIAHLLRRIFAEPFGGDLTGAARRYVDFDADDDLGSLRTGGLGELHRA